MEGTTETILHENDIVELVTEAVITDAGDFLDLIAGRPYHSFILRKENFCGDFFRLGSGIAGEILQKVSNYRKRLAIVGDYSGVTSKALKEFIYESNRGRQVVFVETVEEALRLLN